MALRKESWPEIMRNPDNFMDWAQEKTERNKRERNIFYKRNGFNRVNNI